MMTDDDIAKAQALCEAAKPGPWHVFVCMFEERDRASEGGNASACGIDTGRHGHDGWADVFRSDNREECSHPIGRADAEFVAAARELVPALLDDRGEVGRQRDAAVKARDLAEGRLDALRQELDRHGAPTHDDAGRKLNQVGRTIDLIHAMEADVDQSTRDHAECVTDLITAHRALTMNQSDLREWTRKAHEAEARQHDAESLLAACREHVKSAVADSDAKDVRIRELELLINTPRIDNFVEAVKLEAAHQRTRWGTDHDGGKRPEDWIALIVYLLGKATKAHFDGGYHDKLLHHIITVAAVCANWHDAMTDGDNRMRPGVGPRQESLYKKDARCQAGYHTEGGERRCVYACDHGGDHRFEEVR